MSVTAVSPKPRQSTEEEEGEEDLFAN